MRRTYKFAVKGKPGETGQFTVEAPDLDRAVEALVAYRDGKGLESKEIEFKGMTVEPDGSPALRARVTGGR